jgi:hypothetical protein
MDEGSCNEDPGAKVLRSEKEPSWDAQSRKLDD